MEITKARATRLLLLAALTVAFLGFEGAFVPATAQIDHFKVYEVDDVAIPPEVVTLQDQFGTMSGVNVDTWDRFGVVVDKNDEGVIDPNAHQTWYPITGPQLNKSVRITNQFETGRTYELGTPLFLVNPAQKNAEPPPAEQNHFECYDLLNPPPGPSVPPASLVTQFGLESVTVGQAQLICNPASKNGSPVLHPDSHLVCYDIEPKVSIDTPVTETDQFGVQASTIRENLLLCVPSSKEKVPALSAQGLGVFLILVAGGAFFLIRRRRSGLAQA